MMSSKGIRHPFQQEATSNVMTRGAMTRHVTKATTTDNLKELNGKSQT